MCAQEEPACPPELQPFLGTRAGGGGEADEAACRDRTPGQCLRSQAFWLLFFASAVCSGAGLTLLNNTAQMVRPH